ncbi:hypothetical protein ILYODFUR_027859 [Ilyodon furcidens]|uniref:Uncharacterized protein n=1 Tax=Ilyodon furcidens TaxID=33524 RepID=A0ABV0TYU3_9TELE
MRAWDCLLIQKHNRGGLTSTSFTTPVFSQNTLFTLNVILKHFIKDPGSSEAIKQAQITTPPPPCLAFTVRRVCANMLCFGSTKHVADQINLGFLLTTFPNNYLLLFF